MRVLIVDNAPRQTGVRMYVSNLCRELGNIEGVNVEIADISDASGLGFVSNQTHKIKRSFEIANGLLRIPKNFDVYHLASQFLSVFRARLKPTVITIHDIAGFLSYKDDPVERALITISFSFAKKSERIICPSEFSRREATTHLQLNPNRVRVIPLGIDHTVFHTRDKEECRKRLNLPKDSRIILSVSTTLRHKNLPTVLRAFQMIKKEISNAILVRVGAPNPNTPELQALAQKLGITQSILYMRPSNHELPLVYSSADVFVHTSTYEGFGAPPAEAMACGIPAITSNAASIPEVVGNAAIMLDPYDSEGFASETIRVLKNKELASELSNRGVMRSQLFTWKKCAEQTRQVYEKAVSEYN